MDAGAGMLDRRKHMQPVQRAGKRGYRARGSAGRKGYIVRRVRAL